MSGPVFYFHGLPGSGAELALFGNALAQKTAEWLVPDRAAAAKAADPFQALADEVAARAGGSAVTLVGFSLGGTAALRVAARLGDRVAKLELIAPAAPLQLGDFLGAMAGAPVFRAARNRPAFAALSRVQALAAKLAPGRMRKALFASASPADAALAAQPSFACSYDAMLREGLVRHPASYRREVPLFAGDWSQDLALVTAPVTIWQGSEDNWVPPAMAVALRDALPTGAVLHRLDRLSHYSTLEAVLRGDHP